VACFAAGVGGADAVTVAPYDQVATGPQSSELGRRLARNIQSLLLEESGVARVIDPGGGSWYVEALTDELAAAAWAFFGEIEAAGGMADALRSGLVAARLAATWEARSARLATGADPLTGVSEYPDIDEAPPALAPGGDPTEGGEGSATALPVHRYPEVFERLRARSDRHLATHGQRPTVFLATLGTPAEFTARATFAKNLFEVVGIRALSDETPGSDQVAAFSASGAQLVCICSNDKQYQANAAATAEALVSAGARRVYLAGRPGDLKAEWEAAGVAEFVFLGCDRVDTLARALDMAGVS
jgi:methylmalonyl-CoA mutase